MRQLILALVLGLAAPANAETLIAATLDAAPVATADSSPGWPLSPRILKGLAFAGAALVTFTSMTGGPDPEAFGFGSPVGPFDDLPPHYGAIHH